MGILCEHFYVQLGFNNPSNEIAILKLFEFWHFMLKNKSILFWNIIRVHVYIPTFNTSLISLM